MRESWERKNKRKEKKKKKVIEILKGFIPCKINFNLIFVGH
jgi:hypothetical protein